MAFSTVSMNYGQSYMEFTPASIQVRTDILKGLIYQNMIRVNQPYNYNFNIWHMPLKILIYTFLFAGLVVCSPDDSLLKMGQKDNCIKNIIQQHLHQDDCHLIKDSTKSELALKMTNCLFKQMKRDALPACQKHPCEIKGDAWNTFSIFFNHIDNLCHFYREIIWQERAQSMVVSLTESAEITYDLMQKNSKETNKIIGLQNSIKDQMEDTIKGQRDMVELLGNSTSQINKLTQDVQKFLFQIHDDIQKRYSSLQTILSVISQTLDKLTAIQNYLVAQVHSVNGILFYLLLFISNCFLTSIRKYQEKRNFVLTIVILSFLVEWVFGSYVNMTIGNRVFRSFCMLAIITILFNSESKQKKIDNVMKKHLNTAKMARILKKTMQLREFEAVKFTDI